LEKSASEVIAQGDLGAVVDYVIGLNRKKARIDRELETAKAYLRGVAREKQGGRKEVELEGLTGEVTVVFQGLSFKTKKGADLAELKVNLPAVPFASLFKHTVVVVPAMPAEDFLEELLRQKPEHQKTIGHFIEIEEPTPKVYVPR